MAFFASNLSAAANGDSSEPRAPPALAMSEWIIMWRGTMLRYTNYEVDAVVGAGVVGAGVVGAGVVGAGVEGAGVVKAGVVGGRVVGASVYA